MKTTLAAAVLLAAIAAGPILAGDVPGTCPALWPIELRTIGPGQAGGESTRAELAIEGNRAGGLFVLRIWRTEYIQTFSIHETFASAWSKLEATTLYQSRPPYLTAQACFYYRKHDLHRSRQALRDFLSGHFTSEASGPGEGALR